jgi:hypothetical protein
MLMRARTTAALVGALVSGGCYLNTPIDTAVTPPVAGDMVALDVSDRGRVALGERFGGGVSQIEGRLTSVTERTFELQVYKVTYLREGDSRWSGEKVSIERDAIGQVYTRTFSRRRTLVAAGVVGGALLAFILTRELVAGGGEENPTQPPPGPDQVRIPRLQLIH